MPAFSRLMNYYYTAMSGRGGLSEPKVDVYMEHLKMLNVFTIPKLIIKRDDIFKL